MRLTGKDILRSLRKARWETARRTYGNNHATLIGLLVDWWAFADPKHFALESGPSNGLSKKGERGQCDAFFCCNGDPVGVLEVEGNRHKDTVEKIGTFFDGYKKLQFGVLLVYATSPVGRGQRQYRTLPDDETCATAKTVTRQHPGKPLIIIVLNKKYAPICEGIRARSKYYKGTPSRIEGFVSENGRNTRPALIAKFPLPQAYRRAGRATRRLRHMG